jgi:hypothetical protein
MKAKLLSVAVALVALATASPALADGSGGSGGAQAGAQNASTNQGALGIAASNQNAVNANVPVSIAGGNVSAGPSTATQNAASTATADVSNKAKTDQDQHLTQNVGPSGCYAGCGGSGGFQAGVQNAGTNQLAVGAAISKQNAVNANVPVSIAGGNVSSGPSTATQNAASSATTDVSNKAKTDQDQGLKQNIGSGCGCDSKGSDHGSSSAGSGGDGGFQAGIQNAETNQGALGAAVSKQNAVNANVPVSIAGGNVYSGPSTATQNASSAATTDVSNKAKTDQDQWLKQNVGNSCGCDSKGKYDPKRSYDPKGSSDHSAGSGGDGGFQLGAQNAETNQFAAGLSKSDQNAVNANVPVSIAGGDVKSGPSTATQNAASTATTDVSNKAKTDQDQGLTQNVGGGSSCLAGCGGAGGFQLGVQKADTNQWAAGAAFSNQNAVNSNTPVSIAGGNIYSGPSTATQNAASTATTDVSNKAKTDQDQYLTQNVGSGCGCDSKGKYDPKGSSGHSSGCIAGCGGDGGFQVGLQNAETNQWAAGIAKSDQNAVNGNSPASTAGGNISSGPSTATQNASSSATADVSNKAKTDQDQYLTQNVGGGSSCLFGCGGAGGFQAGIQNAYTKQGALGIAASNQNAVNGNSPASTAGGNIYSGPSTATQNASSSATADVSNKAKTDQDQYLTQNVGSGCGCDSKGKYDPKGYGSSSDRGNGCGCDGSSDHNRGCIAGCGGAGGFQVGLQNAETNQWAAGIAKSDQNAVNGNSPASTAGGNISSGPSTATQNAASSATADVSNKAKTDQDQHLRQNVGGGSCLFGCGGPGGFQLGLQNAETNQWAAGIALSYQNAVNGNSPASTAGGNIYSGPSTATQNAASTGDTDVSNRAKTDQDQGEHQSIGKSCGDKCGPTGIRSEAPISGGAAYSGAPASQIGSQGSNSGDLAKSDHNREQQPNWQS